MQVQSINKANQPAFGVRIGAKTLQRFSAEVGQSKEGTQTLKSVLDEFQKIGNKNTVVEFKPVIIKTENYYNEGTEAYDYQDEGSYSITNYYIPMTITNSLFPNSSYSADVRLPKERNLFEAVSSAILGKDEWSNGDKPWLSSIIENSEVKLFGNFIDSFKEKNENVSALEETNNILDFIKSGFKPEQAHSMVEQAQKKDHSILSRNIARNSAEIDELRKKLETVEQERDILIKESQKANSLRQEMDNFIDSNTNNARQSLLDQYI